ncbi:unnamed protein product, partial [Bubo scandiacus]
MVTAVELQWRESKDSDKLYPSVGHCLEDTDHSEFEDRPSNSSIQKMLNNVNDRAKIKSGADLEAVKTCELCEQNLIIDVNNFNVNAHYRNHQQLWRSAKLMRLNHSLVTRKR